MGGLRPLSDWTVNLVSAFGRGETLALALHENGFQVKVLDFTSAFAPEYQRGFGPFPVVDKAFSIAQRELLNDVTAQTQGLTLWLGDGPIELTGPLASVHIHSHPEIQAWKTNSLSGDFSRTWLQHFLRQWTSPYFSESWGEALDTVFPAELALGDIPDQKFHGFERMKPKKIEVLNCSALRDVQLQGNRVANVEIEAGNSMALNAQQWVWCLSSSETEKMGKTAARKLFGREIFQPEWAWLSFGGVMSKGPWTAGLPNSVVVIGDVYLPWYYSNVAVLKRVDETRFRIWIKVPRSRAGDIDARRGWASELQRLMTQRLPLAAWKMDSGDWNLCPHSEIYPASLRGKRVNQFKNWNLIAPSMLKRLDLSARLEVEAETFKRLQQWRNQESKKQGGRRDHALHAP
jgi:hypothetical protein